MSVSERYTFDSNIFFYAVDSDAGERHQTAQNLLANANYNKGVIVLQTLGELCHAVHRKRPKRLGDAHAFVEECLELFETASATAEDVTHAIRAQRQHGFQFWDAMLWATAKRLGCKTIFSEDFREGRVLEGVTIRNPFRLSLVELNGLLR